ncbi:hypothetical protein E5288_WYG019818 [Bos mutus]|uniref:Uncharacterized protein n=1 Tax=Bos mutus TaxID=72004 RepID=A0A6B0RXR6_9CETA|nr:hypothetical protein [Bos mutus]
MAVGKGLNGDSLRQCSSAASGSHHQTDDVWAPGSLTSQGPCTSIGLIRALCSKPDECAMKTRKQLGSRREAGD